jgi:hypothetical protein
MIGNVAETASMDELSICEVHQRIPIDRRATDGTSFCVATGV